MTSQMADMAPDATVQQAVRFPDAERAALLGVKGVGPTVVARLEAIGIGSLAELARQDVDGICTQVSLMLGSTCWRNSPMARAAIAGAIARAQSDVAAQG